ncbi:MULTISPECIES: helix-turn-helix domain-containing protein [Actinosynnema]|uniref:helix-turn-helix domain-containing protein n=1 Tax=Actinosynnema TaxID=40566 RepID=UPI0020A6156A|nr:helix-turn-helix transcriptional regulator [Actinosynnema pretiosum]MCP2094095.1 Transcriptional regulator, contains XRE-family HTH domain [Actinosynnema pretiosum]
MTVLLREAIGDRLRHARTTQRRTLREVSRTARVSLGYLSEVERGRKEASSELLAAICDALELPLSELLHLVATDIGAVDKVAKSAELGKREPARAGLEAGTLVPAVVGNDLSDLRLQPVLTHRLPTAISKPRGSVVAA